MNTLASALDNMVAIIVHGVMKEAKTDAKKVLGLNPFKDSYVSQHELRFHQSIIKIFRPAIQQLIADDKIDKKITELFLQVRQWREKYGNENTAFRPTRNPTCDSYAHLRPLFLKHIEELKTMIEEQREKMIENEQRLKVEGENQIDSKVEQYQVEIRSD